MWGISVILSKKIFSLGFHCKSCIPEKKKKSNSLQKYLSPWKSKAQDLGNRKI